MTSVVEKIEVRRKYKKRSDGRIHRWFLVRGSEPDLQTLEQEWDKVHSQTEWKLEHCYKPLSTSPEIAYSSTTGSNSFFYSDPIQVHAGCSLREMLTTYARQHLYPQSHGYDPSLR